MNRIILIIIMCLLLAGCGVQDGVETTLPAETTAPAQTTVPGPEGILEENPPEIVYLLTRMTVSSGRGSPDWYREYRYDGTTVVGETEYTDGAILISRKAYTYNSQGLVETMVVSHMAFDDPERVEMELTTRYTYNEAGLLSRMEIYENDVLSSVETYVYDDQGRLIRSENYPGGVEEIRYIVLNTYDEAGNLTVKEERYGEELMFRTEYTYDETGLLTGSTDFDSLGNVGGSMTVTWEGSTKTVVYTDMTGETYLTDITTFNDSGEPTYSESTYADGAVVVTEYTYEPIEIQK